MEPLLQFSHACQHAGIGTLAGKVFLFSAGSFARSYFPISSARAWLTNSLVWRDAAAGWARPVELHCAANIQGTGEVTAEGGSWSLGGNRD